MNRRDLISAVLGLPAMAGIKVSPLRPDEPMDKPVPMVAEAAAPSDPFLIVLQPERPITFDAINDLRAQMREFLDSAGVNAKAVVLPYGLGVKTVTPDGVVHGGEPPTETAPTTKPWCGQLVYDWCKASGIAYRNFTAVSRRRSFDVVETPRGWLLHLKTVVGDGRPYVTESLVRITVNNEVFPYEAAWLIDTHERGLKSQEDEAIMAELMKFATPKKEST
jgi:hypothetical protein